MIIPGAAHFQVGPTCSWGMYPAYVIALSRWPIFPVLAYFRNTHQGPDINLGSDWESQEPNNSRADGVCDLMLFDVICTWIGGINININHSQSWVAYGIVLPTLVPCLVSFCWAFPNDLHGTYIGAGAADQNNAVAAMACEGVKGVIDWDKSRALRQIKLERKILGSTRHDLRIHHAFRTGKPLMFWGFLKWIPNLWMVYRFTPGASVSGEAGVWWDERPIFRRQNCLTNGKGYHGISMILVGGLEHFLFSIIYGIIFPIDSYFSEGLEPPTRISYTYILAKKRTHKYWTPKNDETWFWTNRDVINLMKWWFSRLASKYDVQQVGCWAKLQLTDRSGRDRISMGFSHFFLHRLWHSIRHILPWYLLIIFWGFGFHDMFLQVWASCRCSVQAGDRSERGDLKKCSLKSRLVNLDIAGNITSLTSQIRSYMIVTHEPTKMILLEKHETTKIHGRVRISGCPAMI